MVGYAGSEGSMKVVVVVVVDEESSKRAWRTKASLVVRRVVDIVGIFFRILNRHYDVEITEDLK